MSKKEDITINNLTFRYSTAIEGYYADLGEHQVQILSERDGHWHMSIPFIEMETESHSPEDTAKLGYDFLKTISEHFNK